MNDKTDRITFDEDVQLSTYAEVIAYADEHNMTLDEFLQSALASLKLLS